MKIVWTEQALSNLVSIRDYIARDSEVNARLVASRILNSVSLLKEQPEMGKPGEIPDTRELVVSRTPYIIFYRVKHGGLRLLAILHGSQRKPDLFDA